MTHSFTTDTRGTSTVVATALLIFIIIVTATAAGAYVTDQFREETSDTTEIIESKIDTPTHDQVHISPLVGDDLELDTVEVRIEFLDRDAPPAVVTNLQAATDHSTSTQVTTTRTVDTAGEYEPVTKTVTSYEPTGETTTEATLPVYNWSKDVEVERHVYEWRVWNDGDSLAEQQSQTAESATEPEGWDNVRKVGKMKVFKVSKERSYAPGTYKSRECVENKWRDCYYPRVNSVKSWHTTTVTETVYTEAPVQPGDGWTKVSEESVGTETYTLEEPQPVYEERTREVVVGYDVSNTTQEVETEQTLYAAEDAVDTSDAAADADADVDASAADRGVEQRLDAAAANAAFLDGPGVDPAANTAVGVGGTLGTSTSGTWTQGETVVVQLDRPLLFEGDRVRVEIIDRETNSLVMDRTVRIENTERFQFSPEGGTTVASESAPASPEVDVAADAPDTSLGDLPDADSPDVNISDGDSPEPSDGTSTTGGNESDIVVPPEPDSGDVEGEPKEEFGGYVTEPSDSGGTVTIVHPDHEGELLGSAKNTEIVSANADKIPIPDQAVTTDLSSDAGSNTGFGFSRLSGTASLTGLTGGGGTSGSSGGSPTGSIPGYSGGGSGGGSSGGGPSGNPGGGGVV